MSDGYDSGVQDIWFFSSVGCLWCFHVGLLLICSVQGRFYFIFILLSSDLTLWYLQLNVHMVLTLSLAQSAILVSGPFSLS